MKESDKPGVPQTHDVRKPAISSRSTQRSYAIEGSGVPPNLTRDLEAKIENQKTEMQSDQRDLESTQDSLNKCQVVLTESARSAENNTKTSCSSEHTTSERFESSNGCLQFISSDDLFAD